MPDSIPSKIFGSSPGMFAPLSADMRAMMPWRHSFVKILGAKMIAITIKRSANPPIIIYVHHGNVRYHGRNISGGKLGAGGLEGA